MKTNMAKVPNGPSKTGNPSGKGRGNLPSKKKANRYVSLVVGLSLFLSYNAFGQMPTGIYFLEAQGSYICWGANQNIKLSWSIYESYPIECHINFDEKVSCYFNVGTDDYKLFMDIANKFNEWIQVARQNNVTKTFKQMPIDMGEFHVFELQDGYRNWSFGYLDCIGAYFKIDNGKAVCQIVFRAEKESLESGNMSEESHNYGMQFGSPQEVQTLAECLDYEWLNKLKWGDGASVIKNSRRKMDQQTAVDQLFK